MQHKKYEQHSPYENTCFIASFLNIPNIGSIVPRVALTNGTIPKIFAEAKAPMVCRIV